MSVDHFAGRADSYDQNPCRVDNVANIAHAILRGVHIDRASHLLDLGSGTGLLLERIAPHAGRITALDASGHGRRTGLGRGRSTPELGVASSAGS